MVAFGLFSHTITLGSVVVTLVVIGAVGYFAVRGKATERAEQTARDFRDNYLAEKERADSLQQQVAEQRELKHAARSEVLALQKLTDLSAVMRQLAEVTALVVDVRKDMSIHFDAFSKTQNAQTSTLAALTERITQERP